MGAVLDIDDVEWLKDLNITSLPPSGPCSSIGTALWAIAGALEKAHTGVGRATLYRRPELRAIVEEHRQHGRDALALTGLQVQIDQLRLGLEAVAAKTRRHEEQLRKLHRSNRTE